MESQSPEAIIEAAKTSLATASEKHRQIFLRETLLPFLKSAARASKSGDAEEGAAAAAGEDEEEEKLSTSQKQDLVRLLISTVFRFEDPLSREAVLDVLAALLEVDGASATSNANGAGGSGGIKAGVIKYLEIETDKLLAHESSVAPSTKFALLGWATTVFGTHVKLDGEENASLVLSLAGIFEAVMDERRDGGKTKVKEGLRRSAVVRTRRVVRNNHKTIPFLLSTLSSPSPATTKHPFRTASLLGLVIDVALHLKDPKGAAGTGVGLSYVTASKDKIDSFYSKTLLGAKTTPPSHVLNAFNNYLALHNTTPTPFLSQVKPVTPSLLSAQSLFTSLPPQSYSASDIEALLKVLGDASKSTDEIVRSSAIQLFGIVFRAQPDATKTALDTFSLPLSTGKTSSATHRATLFSMLSLLPPSPTSSSSLVSLTLPLIAKESSEVAYFSLMDLLEKHLPSAVKTISDADSKLLAKAAGEVKVKLRRRCWSAIGEVFWSLMRGAQKSEESAKTLAESLMLPLETALKTVSANPLAAPAGSLEGLVAVMVLVGGSAGKWASTKIDEVAKKNPTLTSLLTSGAKPSFLLWDKVWKKASAVEGSEDEKWVVRALTVVLERDEEKILKDAGAKEAFSRALGYWAVEGERWETRKEALVWVDEVSQRGDRGKTLIREGVRVWLVAAEKEDAKPKKPTTLETEEKVINYSSRLRPILSALARASGSSFLALSDLLVLAHHPRLTITGFWIDLVRSAGVDPQLLVEKMAEDLLKLIWEDASLTPASSQFAEAAYSACRTIAFVQPSLVVPLLFKQLEDDLDVEKLRFIGSNEFGVWATPEGETFVDVLAPQKKGKAPTYHKGSKEHEIAVWEAELREALARKKPAVATLSKSDRQLLEKQLAKEAVTRTEMANALGRLRRGFSLCLCLIKSGAEGVREYLKVMVKDVLDVVVLRPATLVTTDAFDTFQSLGDICSERLGQSKVALGVAVLRAMSAPIVPDDFAAEPLGALVTRVLYRLRILADQAPFDAGTFAYSSPLTSRVLRSGGVGVEKGDQEAALEQVALALDFIAFHCRECSDVAFPRLAMIGDLISTLIGHPSLSRIATSALSDLAGAVADTATTEEINALLDGVLTEEAYVRFACLQALSPLDLTELEFPASLWISCHDVDERNASIALAAWDENGLDVPRTFLVDLVPFLSHSSNAVRRATAQSIAEGINLLPELIPEAIERLVAEYREKVKDILPQYDQYGMVIEESLTVEDPWRTRVAIALTLKLISVHFSSTEVDSLFNLLIGGGALGDKNQAVRSEMLEAAIVAIDTHGKETLHGLIVTFEAYLAQPSSGDVVQDHITEALVILFGRLARHLEPKDPRIASVIKRLVDALRTPSEVVQAAVCDCLPPLIRVIKDEVPMLVDQLMTDMFQAPKYAERRGAAYGLAGVVAGRGLSSLKEFGVLGRLQDNAEDKKSVHARQGAIFGYEILATVLGRLFEPYVPEILPILLACFGDASTDVREATQDAAKAIMSKLSGHAVKLILPTLLSGLDDKQWRAKKGAIELMGAMAFLAPRQLSSSLPTIIPRLTDVVTDTHKQVRESANTSLKRFGEVVTNPEIQAMQAVLLEALVDPSRKTPKALDALLATTFAHFIDSSSLALVIPILDRGLRERSADIKRKAAAIVGNMATLTEAKDLVPYLSQLVPLLRSVLIDPVPEARSTAAKSLGGLVERLGEPNFPDLIDQLLEVLKSPASGVDQQGAAQGVSEILAGLGVERLEGLLPAILANTSSPRAYVREGHISLLIFLPTTFGERFAPYLGRIIQPVLSGLADDSDYVREASMRAGRMIVANHSTRAIDLLLPELELGLFDQSWRIRQSSVQLVGDLLFRISGVVARADEDDDVEEEHEDRDPGTEAGRKALVETLGKDRRDRVFAALYIVRQDSTGAVRQAAIHVWKALVQNTPRTVREILPVLMQIIVRTLASPGVEQRETAARCLADTCRRLGEAVLGEVIAILQRAMTSPDRRQREGVCLAMTEIMANTSPSSLEAHEGAVIVIVRGALVDPDPLVRSAAAQSFDVAQQVIGARSIDETIPTLLDALQVPGETADAALEALKEVMAVRADKIFPVLIPRLIATPITAFNARALASLVRVAGPALSRRLTHIVDALQKATTTEKDADTLQEIDEALTAVLGSVEDHETGLGSLQMHMLGLAKGDSPAKRVTGCSLFQRFCQATESDFIDSYAADWIRQLVSLFNDGSSDVVGGATSALAALVSKVDKDDMEPLVVPLRRTIESTGVVGHPVDGFSRPNGLKPILPILLQGLLNGTAEQREQAAFAFGDLVERTAPDAFKAYCIQTVGPLIRVIGDRFPAPVKSAILSTLTIFLTRVPQFVKPFFPQLQRTFVKSLADPSSLSVRNRAVSALGVLMQHQPRVDPLITELANLVAAEDGEVRDSAITGLAAVVASAGSAMSESSKSSIVDLLSEGFLDTNKETYNVAIAKLTASLAKIDPPSVQSLVETYLLGDLPSTQLSSVTLREMIESAPQAFYTLDVVEEVVTRVLRNCEPTNPPAIARPARDARDFLKEVEPFSEDDAVRSRL